MFEYDFHTYTPKSSSCNTEFITHGVLIGCFFSITRTKPLLESFMTISSVVLVDCIDALDFQQIFLF